MAGNESLCIGMLRIIWRSGDVVEYIEQRLVSQNDRRRIHDSIMAAATSVVVLDRGNNTTCTINLHGACGGKQNFDSVTKIAQFILRQCLK